MDRSKIRPLRSIHLKGRPINPRAIAWSCDAELAVALDETIQIFPPDIAKPGGKADASVADTISPQYSTSLSAAGVFSPSPAINAQLCAAAGVSPLDDGDGSEMNIQGGVGKGLVTASGASLHQVVKLEWSPSGLGCNLRPILAALLTNGSVVAIGEHLDSKSATSSNVKSRSFRSWHVLWGLGASMPLPDENSASGFISMKERITSFSWAGEVAQGRALLAYRNDDDEVSILSIQLYAHDGEDELHWEIQKVAGFDGKGIHIALDHADPDFSPCGTGFALKWSPWVIQNGSRTATLAYIAHHNVCFRRITVQGPWEKGSQPVVQVEDVDTTRICLRLSPDAFVEWENTTDVKDDIHVGRGVLVTPFEVRPFQVALTGPFDELAASHEIWECPSMTLPTETSTSPITGLITHPPDPSHKSPVPHYSLVRLSATSENKDWYQTNLPPHLTVLPQWAKKISKDTSILIPRSQALTGAESESDSDDSDEAMIETNVDTVMAHPHRFRIWDLAASPGGGSTAVLVSKHDNLHPDRHAKSRLMFGWHSGEASPRRSPDSGSLTVEGQMWERMYGGGEEVIHRAEGTPSQTQGSKLHEIFQGAISHQRCGFCDSAMQYTSGEAKCENGHAFATCVATGLAIMAPGISHVCGICGLRCLKQSEMARLAKESLGSNVSVSSLGEVCGACGGKFVS